MELVDEALRRGARGERAGIRLLVMDGEYADGPLLAPILTACDVSGLAQLKWGVGPDGRVRGIERLVRLPENREACADMQGLAKLHRGMDAKELEVEWEKRREVRYISGHKQDREVECAAFRDMEFRG